MGSFLCCHHCPFSRREKPTRTGNLFKSSPSPTNTPGQGCSECTCMRLGMRRACGSRALGQLQRRCAQVSRRQIWPLGLPSSLGVPRFTRPVRGVPSTQGGSCGHVPRLRATGSPVCPQEEPVATANPQRHLLSLARSHILLLSPDSWDHPRVNPFPRPAPGSAQGEPCPLGSWATDTAGRLGKRGLGSRVQGTGPSAGGQDMRTSGPGGRAGEGW